MAKIMTIDDDEDILFQLRYILTRAGHEVLPLLRADRLIEQVRKAKPDLVITDIVMPGIMGGGVYNLIREKIGPHLPIIISSGTRLRLRGTDQDPLVAYCPKPVDFDELNACINELLEKKSRIESGEEDLDEWEEPPQNGDTPQQDSASS